MVLDVIRRDTKEVEMNFKYLLTSYITSRRISRASYTFQHKVRFTMRGGDILFREVSHRHHAFKKSK